MLERHNNNELIRFRLIRNQSSLVKVAFKRFHRSQSFEVFAVGWRHIRFMGAMVALVHHNLAWLLDYHNLAWVHHNLAWVLDYHNLA